MASAVDGQRTRTRAVNLINRHMPKKQILIVEDDGLLAQDLEYRLESLNYEVCAKTIFANEAISLARDLHPDLVLMDIQLSGEMDGIQAAEQIRTFPTPIVFVTGHLDGPILERAKLTEPCGYVRKPFETADLKVAIEIGLHNHGAERERQRITDQLKRALDSARTLSGMLPICCYCKKIKEDSGVWTQVESYIMKRTNASFTHGMCPECFRRLKTQLDTLQKTGPSSQSIVLG